MRTRLTLALAALALASCNNSQPQQGQTDQPTIKVRGPAQDRLHELDALNLAIALKRAIYDSGFRCKRITDAGFVGEYKNVDMWVAHCDDKRDWAVFAGPDGSAQVRDCKDLKGTEVPECVIHQRPKGSFGLGEDKAKTG